MSGILKLTVGRTVSGADREAADPAGLGARSL